ncbi:hypothetical protein GDO81_017540 [Engystomops pustulosus]|uniref:Uncharacterized protein n=1 Tax=Engystomops pustulosus TaxID=76066 RepID=A0AAV7A0X3_ENGPU|nr:hypothetical protein GDO81_017540 [Engystomops pustulosus]
MIFSHNPRLLMYGGLHYCDSDLSVMCLRWSLCCSGGGAFIRVHPLRRRLQTNHPPIRHIGSSCGFRYCVSPCPALTLFKF